MTTTIPLADLILTETKAAIYQKAIDVAVTLGLPVTSWQAGSPTRSMYHVLSQVLSTVEEIVSEYIKAGFLDYAGDVSATWLKLLAYQVYGYTATEATYATCSVTLSNAGGGEYTFGVGDVTAKATSSGKTYHNTTAGTLTAGPGTTLVLSFEADEAGSDSSAAIGEIDDLVTSFLGVTCSNTTAAVGIDEEDAASIVAGCRAKLGALSPNGPRDAYDYVAQSSALTGTTNVTRSVTVGDSDTGDVTVYVAGPSGAVDPADVALVQTAIETYAAPLCITPTVSSASNVSVPITYRLWVYQSIGMESADIQSAIADALAEMFAARPIGGDLVSGVGKLWLTMVESTIQSVFPEYAFRVLVTLPAADTTLTASQVAVLGTITPTITFVSDP
jgi:hypothetical protein